MSINRVTQHTIASHSLAGLQGNIARVALQQERLSTGRQINRPSDSPSGTASALQFRGDIRRNAQWSRNADDGVGWLGAIDSTLRGVNTSVLRVRDLTLQGLNSGSLGPAGREALAAEVDQLRSSLVDQANQTYLGRPIFGGTTNATTAYTDDPATGIASYTGNNQQVTRTVGANSTVRVDMSGPEAFGAPGADLFTTLTNISAHLRSGDATQLGTDLGTLDGLSENLRNKLSDVGARELRVEDSRQAADDRGMTLTNSLSEIESIDLPETIMKLEMANVSYQAALGATAKVIQPSLMDFLH